MKYRMPATTTTRKPRYATRSAVNRSGSRNTRREQLSTAAARKRDDSKTPNSAIVRLNNGRTKAVKRGDRLPRDLHPSTVIVLIGKHVFLTDKDVYVKTRLRTLYECVATMRKQGKTSTLMAMQSCSRAILRASANLDAVYRNVKAWRNFCDDCCIVAAYRLYQGRNLTIALERPTQTGETVATFKL